MHPEELLHLECEDQILGHFPQTELLKRTKISNILVIYPSTRWDLHQFQPVLCVQVRKVSLPAKKKKKRQWQVTLAWDLKASMTMPTRKVLQSLPYTMFAYKIPSPQEGTVCPSFPRDIRKEGMILYRFWMGFLLFLPAYVHSPDGIIIFGPKRERAHWVNHMKKPHVTSPHVPTIVTPGRSVKAHWPSCR